MVVVAAEAVALLLVDVTYVLVFVGEREKPKAHEINNIRSRNDHVCVFTCVSDKKNDTDYQKHCKTDNPDTK